MSKALPNLNNVSMIITQLNPADNVAVAVEDLAKGQIVSLGELQIELQQTIPSGHKFAVNDIEPNNSIIKYGAPIGASTGFISVGEHVHSHNLRTQLEGLINYQYKPGPAAHSKGITEASTFDGYVRSDGKVGTRNEIWVISTVGCVAKFAERIASRAEREFEGRCDGIFALTHPFGCSQTGDDQENTRILSAALAQHPNAGGVLFVGLGCENNQATAILEEIPQELREKIRFFNCQQVDDEYEAGLEAIEQLVTLCEGAQRSERPLSDLVVGMKCGGSDGFSGLTANPLVGRISDAISQTGGTVLLTETPEMFGAEQILMNRAVSKDVFDKTVAMINGFKQYFIDHGQNIYDNPSPGNKAGGITTLEEKSMGAIQKGGTAQVVDVLDYGQAFSNKGLNLLSSPGNDAVSSTALTASGATIILFTTGRGTPLGFPAPTLKIASNKELGERKSNWIDFDASPVLGASSFEQETKKLMTDISAIASGIKKTKSEINEQREIAVWKNGVTL